MMADYEPRETTLGRQQQQQQQQRKKRRKKKSKTLRSASLMSQLSARRTLSGSAETATTDMGVSSKLKIRLRILGLLVLVSLPGNLFVLYCYLTSDEAARIRNQTLAEVQGNLSAEVEGKYTCYEDLGQWADTLINFHFWVEGIALTAVGFVGLIGNSLSLAVLTMYDKRNVFNSLLIILAVADSFLLVFFIVDSAYAEAFGYRTNWYARLFPLVIHPLKEVTMTACVYMVVGIAGNRPSAKFSTLLVMATAFLTNFSKFFEFRTVYNGDDQVEIITTKLNEDHRYVVFMSYYTLLVTGFVPLTALCWFNCCIYLQIRRSSKMHGKHVGAKQRSTSPDGRCQDWDEVIERQSSHRSRGLQGETEIMETPMDELSVRDREEDSSNSVITIQRLDNNSSSNNGYKDDLCRMHSDGVRSKRNMRANTDDLSSSPEEHHRFLSPNDVHRYHRRCHLARAHHSSHITKASAKKANKHSRAKAKAKAKTDKSTAILIGIIFVFLMCHALRFSNQLYKVIFALGHEVHFHFCNQKGRLHVPALFSILANFNHLLLVVNSSVNVLIYYCCGERFRKGLLRLFNKLFKLCCWWKKCCCCSRPTRDPSLV